MSWVEPAADRDHELPPAELAERSVPSVVGRYDDGLPFLVERRIDRGTVVFCSTGLQSEWNTLALSRAVIVLDRLSRELLGRTLPRRNFDTTEHRRLMEGFIATTLRRDNTMIIVDQSYDRFQGSPDYVSYLEIARPRNNPYRFFDLQMQKGKFSGMKFNEETLSLGYRPIQKLQVGGTLRHVELGTDKFDQVIMSGNWDLGNDRAVNGRLVHQNGMTNAYVALKRSGNAVAEYFLILGDPNAQQFRSSLILKVTWPLEIKRKG